MAKANLGMRRLTARQQELVVANLDLAHVVAWSIHSRLTSPDERLSSAYLGICLAALTWPGTCAFRPYAWAAAKRTIYRDWRPMQSRPAAQLAEGSLDEIPWPERDSADDAGADEVEWLRGQLYRLTPRQRQTIDLYLAGRKWCDIARTLGIQRADVEGLRRRAVQRLKGACS